MPLQCPCPHHSHLQEYMRRMKQREASQVCLRSCKTFQQFSSTLLNLITRKDAGAINSMLTWHFFQQVPSKCL